MKVAITRKGSAVYYQNVERGKEVEGELVGYTTPDMLGIIQHQFKHLKEGQRFILNSDVDDFLWPGMVWSPGDKKSHLEDATLALDNTMTFTPCEDAPVKDQSIKKEMETIIKVLNSDEGYAWSWYCNLKMAAVDCGVAYHMAALTAVRQLKLIFDLDITKHPYYTKDYADSCGKDLSLTLKTKFSPLSKSSETFVRLEKHLILAMIHFLTSPMNHLSLADLNDRLVKDGFGQVVQSQMFPLVHHKLAVVILYSDAQIAYTLTPIGVNVAKWLTENKPSADFLFMEVPPIAMWPLAPG